MNNKKYKILFFYNKLVVAYIQCIYNTVHAFGLIDIVLLYFYYTVPIVNPKSIKADRLLQLIFYCYYIKINCIVS